MLVDQYNWYLLVKQIFYWMGLAEGTLWKSHIAVNPNNKEK